MKMLPVLILLYATTAGAQNLPAKLAADGWRTDASKATVDLSEVEINIPRDAIRSIDKPVFIAAKDARSWLDDREPVILLEMNGAARAYPLQILTWHEIVNDVVGDTPISVTFCPLCYSAVAFDRRIDGNVHELGVSGMLRHSDMVMFDRTTHSLWQQITGEAIVGTYAGKVLTRLPVQIISFEQFRDAHPAGEVLSRDTGMDRAYGRNPYPGYDDIDERPWMFRGPQDGRLPPMEKVVGVVIDGQAKAYGHALTRKQRVVHDTVSETPLVVFHAPKGAASALDKSSIAESRDLGSTGVFKSVLDGRPLAFEWKEGAFMDKETGSKWAINGKAVDGPLQGAALEPIVFADVFSFAWFVLYPGTAVHE